MKRNQTLILVAILVFLGLSPITEPHIFGKIRWIMGGANGMSTLDWLDVLLHGGSLIIALVLLIGWVRTTINKK